MADGTPVLAGSELLRTSLTTGAAFQPLRQRKPRLTQPSWRGIRRPRHSVNGPNSEPGPTDPVQTASLHR
ncbi:hypothetical protein [Streptomyces platensis]|uniref:hypothetical protein n=1 Tax=Streptomyces platensis TaxID=58346 RepID=UPI0037AA673B